MIHILLNDQLASLRRLFQGSGFDLRFVGGCVRDALISRVPKDVDLCTDADPVEQIAIYRAHGIRYIETGIDHGTITVVLDGDAYEVTSLRLDVETDGRRATVQYTRDWIKDLERRDFTMNAMALTMDGDLLDPFGGCQDLRNGLVRFVGDADVRIQEDYLRILRWFRFRGRFGQEIDRPGYQSICHHAHGLETISRERVWSEIRQILAGAHGIDLMAEIHSMGVGHHINLPMDRSILESPSLYFAAMVSRYTKNPVTLLVSLYHDNAVRILQEWKASSAEIRLASRLNAVSKDCPDPFYAMAMLSYTREEAIELAAIRMLNSSDQARIREWIVPTFPVNGHDLMDVGMTAGPALGRAMDQMRQKWANTGYAASKQELLESIS